jgi:hypothetical protein
MIKNYTWILWYNDDIILLVEIPVLVCPSLYMAKSNSREHMDQWYTFLFVECPTPQSVALCVYKHIHTLQVMRAGHPTRECGS